MMKAQEARQLFSDKLVNHVYLGIISDLSSLLSSEDQIKNPLKTYIELNTWYQGMDECGKGHINNLIIETLYRSIFSVLVVLDNMTEGMPQAEIESDYALFLQSNRNKNARDLLLVSPNTLNYGNILSYCLGIN